MAQKKTVLLADDSQLIRQILFNTLCEEYEILEAVNGVDTLEQIRQHDEEISIVLLDFVMPQMDGLEVLSYINHSGLLSSFPVIMITTENSENFLSAAYDLGASDIIQKPFHPSIIKKRVQNILALFDHQMQMKHIISQQTTVLRKQERKLKETNMIIIDALSTVIEYRSLESGQHIRRIRGFTNILLNFLTHNFPEYHFTQEEIDMISNASAMHDIGKIAIPDAILLKPGKLTPDEFEVMKTHTTQGCEILFRFNGIDDKKYLSCCHDICLYHHERWDGSGYPDGLCGDAIPITAQIVSLADVFDALTHNRVYKEAYSIKEAVDIILTGQCGVFSPFLTTCFIQLLPQFEHLYHLYGDDNF
ncbi:MAG: response regulator [Hungatella sp.]